MVELRRPKCSLCSREAVVTLPYAKVRLCKEHFEEFLLKRVKRVDIPKKVLMATSGGKDSLVTLYLLNELRKRDHIHELKSVTVDTVPGYTSIEAKISSNYAQKFGIEHVTVYAYELYGLDATHYKYVRRSPCGLCSTLRNHALNLVGRRMNFKYVSTGHNLDDMLQVGLSFVISSSLEELRKVRPVEEPLLGALGRVRPLFWVYERDALAFAVNAKLEWLKERCPLYKVGTLLGDEVRNFMHRLEVNHPSIKIRSLKNLMKLSENLSQESERVSSLICKYCGNASFSEVCNVCRLRMRARSMDFKKAHLQPVMDVPKSRGNVPIIGQGFLLWKEIDVSRWTRVEKLLNELGLNREIAVVMDSATHTTIPHDAYIRDLEKGDIVIYLVTRVPYRGGTRSSDIY